LAELERTDPVKIGFFAIGLANLARPETLAAAATTSERVGFSTLWTGEHIVFVEKIESAYPYARQTTAPPVPTDLPILNPFVALGYAAAVTKCIRLATGVCLVPEYNPLLLAKLAASLDFVSGGRFVFGMGIGWMKEEFVALGIPWERRAARAKEAVAAMRRLWEHSVSSHDGEFFSFAGARAFPKPARRIPIIMGGQTDAALKRAASYADGWCGFNLTPAETAEKVRRLDRLLAENGRRREGFEIFVSPVASERPESIAAYRDAGVDELYLAPVFATPFATVAETTEVIEDLGRRWVR
jgi:probable F420-dependent oxidoreductase